MNDQMQTLKDDIAFMRALAQEGQTAQPLGGAILALAGAIFGAGAIVQWAVLSGLLRLSGLATMGVWMGLLAAFLIALFVIKGRMAGKPGAFGPANKATGAVWQGIGWAIF